VHNQPRNKALSQVPNNKQRPGTTARDVNGPLVEMLFGIAREKGLGTRRRGGNEKKGYSDEKKDLVANHWL